MSKPLWPTDKFSPDGSHDGFYGLTDDRLSYFFSRELVEDYPTFITEYRLHITEYLKSRRGDSITPITTNVIDDIKRVRLPKFNDRLRLLMKEIDKRSHRSTKTVTVFGENDKVPLYQLMRDVSVAHTNDLRALLVHLEQIGFIKAQIGQGWAKASLNIAGLIHLDELSQVKPDSDTCFVAMWFSPDMNAAFEQGIRPAIEECGYRVSRIDLKEHNNRIDDEIIAEIRTAKFVLADFSCGPDGARGGVYYEAGFAHGLGIPVIFSVRQEDLHRVHFDTRQFSHIVWQDIEDLRSRLQARIRATII